MTLNDMTTLISAYDAVNELHEVCRILYGIDHGVMLGRGVIGKLDGLIGIICNNSPLYDPDVNVGTGLFWQVLMGKDTAVERARRLMGTE